MGVQCKHQKIQIALISTQIIELTWNFVKVLNLLSSSDSKKNFPILSDYVRIFPIVRILDFGHLLSVQNGNWSGFLWFQRKIQPICRSKQKTASKNRISIGFYDNLEITLIFANFADVSKIMMTSSKIFCAFWNVLLQGVIVPSFIVIS